MTAAAPSRNKSKAGHDRRINGKAGEGLFQYLASLHWRCEFVPHGDAQGTDAHIKWHDLDAAPPLWIQIKHTRQLTSKRPRGFLSPSAIKGSAALRPIIVLCELTTGRAWWRDTLDTYIPSRCETKFPIDIPLTNPVDGTTRDAIRRAAVERWRRSIHYLELPPRLRNLKPDKIEGLIKDTYVEIGRAEGVERDAIALSGARLVQLSSPESRLADLNRLIEPMIHRVKVREQGGRSHSLAALTSVLILGHAGPELRTDFRAELWHIAEFAVMSGDFVHPEFGLLVAARLAETGDASDIERFRDLLRKAAAIEQTARFRAFAEMIGGWMPGSGPLVKLVGPSKMRAGILRRSDPAIDIFNRQDEAEEAVARAIEHGASRLSAAELELIDHWTRYRADQYFQNELGRYLFGNK